MATIAEQLTSLANTKTAIKDAIVAKGVAVADTDPFSAYPAKIAEIQAGGGAPATKFGASVDTFLGDVDENGMYTPPTEPFTLDLTGIKTVATGAFVHRFGGSNTGAVKKIIANDLRTAYADAFMNAFEHQSYIEEATFGVEEVFAANVFKAAFLSSRFDAVCFFNLKKVSGQSVFEQAFNNAGQTDLDKAFPVLEEISGIQAFYNFVTVVANRIYAFSSVKKIIGGSASYRSTLGAYYSKCVWHLPRATELSGYVWNISSSYTSEIHFAAANQAALEACDGYANKWGNAGATIYFDLMLNITVDGVVYSRKHTIGGYTSWESDSGEIVYTDATAEPATGTVVYSDQGTTQVGTVSEAA